MKTTFTTNTSNTIYEANETMTYCWKFPFGEKGKRVRISKGEFLEAQAIHEQEQEEALQRAIEKAEEERTTEELKEIQDLYCRHPEGSDLQNPATLNENGCVDCSKCNVQNCIHRDCMRRNPTNKGGLAECPRLKVKEEQPKKAKKTRKSKDVAYEGNGLTLTAKQVDFIHHLPDTYFWEMGVHSVIWVDCLCDDIGGQFNGKPMTVGAMISTLCEKGLGFRTTQRRENKKCVAFSLTELGKKVAAEVGLQ